MQHGGTNQRTLHLPLTSTRLLYRHHSSTSQLQGLPELTFTEPPLGQDAVATSVTLDAGAGTVMSTTQSPLSTTGGAGDAAGGATHKQSSGGTTAKRLLKLSVDSTATSPLGQVKAAVRVNTLPVVPASIFETLQVFRGRESTDGIGTPSGRAVGAAGGRRATVVTVGGAGVDGVGVGEGAGGAGVTVVAIGGGGGGGGVGGGGGGVAVTVTGVAGPVSAPAV